VGMLPIPEHIMWDGHCHLFAVLGAPWYLGCMQHFSEWRNDDGVMGAVPCLLFHF